MGDWFAANTSEKNSTADAGSPGSAPSTFFQYRSRRSPVVCRKGCVSSSQPLASSIGLDLLRRGANAAETAVAVAAALAVLEPCSTGLGGDMFCLYYDASTKKVQCINGSGKSPMALSLETVKDSQSFASSAHVVTVPGAAKGWEDLWERHGSGQFDFADLVEPAALLAEEGFPVAPMTSHHWNEGMDLITRWLPKEENAKVPMTVDGKRAPKAGEIMVNTGMARVLRDLGKHGAEQGFYNGETGKAIVEAVQRHGGTMTMEDLENHTSVFPKPIYATYRDQVKLWQVPPNGQGIAALIALKGLDHLESKGLCPRISPATISSADTLHVEMEMMRLGFQDAKDHVSSPDHMRVSNDWLLSSERIGTRAEEAFDPTKARVQGQPFPSSCTVSFQVVDTQGNAISFVNSNFIGFGSGIVPANCGFTLQNRGFGFSLDPQHPNALAGGKRPFHTIIPGILTHADTDELYATLTNMGGNMQPQGHLQLTVDLVAGELDPQTAVDMPRFCIADGKRDGVVSLEEGIDDSILEELKKRGHKMETGLSGTNRSLFGRAQIIKRDRETGVLWAGSDGRSDGCAMGF